MANVETLQGLERRVSMKVPADDIERQVDERLKKLARNIRMPGFRPGKVPMKLVAQTYGPQVRSEVLSDAVQKAFTDAVKEANLKVAGYPRIEKKDGADTKALEFSATFEIYPEVKVGDLGEATVERPQVAIDDAAVDKTIEILRKQRTKFVEASRAAKDGDRLTVDFEGTIDGQPFQGGAAKDFTFPVGEGRMLKVVATHLGLRPAERREQVERLLELFTWHEQERAVLMGDVNEWFLWGRPLKHLHRYFDRTRAVATFPSGRPVLALDRLWTHPGSILRGLEAHATPLARVASDHLPLVASIEI